jgi:hypothetical protein
MASFLLQMESEVAKLLSHGRGGTQLNFRNTKEATIVLFKAMGT